jgi:hypothetical protein
MRRSARRFLVIFSTLLAASLAARAQTGGGLDPKVQAAVDAAAAEVLAASKVPSASIAIVANGRLAYAKAYGDARVDPRTPATVEMRYSIGSVSKQFTATAMLMLAEEGKLSLDDPVARFLPDLTRAKDVRIRQLLSHTSGYSDYWPQDYVPPFMLRPATAESILGRWARQPLDFEPGTKYRRDRREGERDAAARPPQEADLRAARHAERGGRGPRPAHGVGSRGLHALRPRPAARRAEGGARLALRGRRARDDAVGPGEVERLAHREAALEARFVCGDVP